MADASFLQTNFLGGQWSPFAQGRADMEQYRTACNVMLNYVALEVGAATRRSGTRTLGTTRGGVAAALRAFDFTQALPFEAEFTPGHLRLWAGLGLLLEDQHQVAAISTATPAVVTTAGAHGYTTGDEVEFAAMLFLPGTSTAGLKAVLNKQWVATVIDATHFSLSDPVTGASLNGSSINTVGWNISVSKVVDFTTPYLAADLPNLRLVQNEDVALILDANYQPQALTNTVVPTTDQLAVFAWNNPVFLDGPYLDPPTDGTTLEASALSGTITLTASSINSINGGVGFLATDVGRLMRLFSEPPQWNSGTSYAKGANITYGNVQWQAVAGNTGVQPDTDPGTHWVINPTGAIWTWGTIASVVSDTQVTLTLAAADPLMVNAGGSLLYSGGSNLISQWQLGLYSDTTGWPSVGGFHEGRFWLGGVTANRVDSSQANGDTTTAGTTSINFGPTLLDGSVPDNCGISAIFSGPNRNAVFWILPDHQGVVIGTQGGEWLMQASQLNEPLTPTSIQAHLVTRYGVSNIEPRSTGLSHVFVHRYQLQLYEYITDVFSGKFIGTNIGRKARDIISPGIAEIAYQAEKAPIVWSRTTDGRLLGCTYKRESPFSTQPASYMAWHHHPLGSGRLVTGIQAGPAPGGATDSLALVTQDPNTGIYYIELLADLPEETDTLMNAWFADGAAVPASAYISGSDLILTGLQYLAGDTIMAWIAGTDAGSFVVAADGTVTIPLPAGLLTQSFLASLTGTFGALNLAIQVTPPGTGFNSPVGSALFYTSSSNAPSHYNATTVFDWDANRIYHQQAAAGGDPETNGHTLFIFNIDTQAQVAGPLDPGQLAFGIPALGYDGNIYYVHGLSADAGRWNAKTQTNDASYIDTHSIGSIGSVVALTDGVNGYLVGGGLDSGQGGGNGDSSPVSVYNMSAPSPYALQVGSPTSGVYTALADEHPNTVSPGNVVFSRGPTGSAFATFVGPEGGVGAWTLGLYRVMLDGEFVFTMPKIGTRVPTDFDAGWTNVIVNTLLYDETDGNVIASVTGAGNSNVYLVKLNTGTATIMWQLQIHSNVDFHTSRIRGGRFSFIDGPSSPYPLKFIDTIHGTVLTSTNETVIAPNVFSTDDGSGCVVVELNDIGNTMWTTFGCTNVPSPENITPAIVYNAPAVIGFDYNSDLQILRPVSPQESGSQNGPSQGKTRRNFRAAPYFANTVGTDGQIGVKMGTYFTKLRSVRFQSPGGTIPLTPQQLFTGIYRDTVDDDYSFNGMWCCRTNRGYPTTVVSVECFLHTQDL